METYSPKIKQVTKVALLRIEQQDSGEVQLATEQTAELEGFLADCSVAGLKVMEIQVIIQDQAILEVEVEQKVVRT